MSRPVLGSQAADNAAWDEIRAALRGEAPVSLPDVIVDEMTSVVESVVARLVDQAVAAAVTQCGHDLVAARQVDDEAVGALARRWLDATWEQMQ